jgi:tetratricopeptide (TPR) repeat protein
MSEQSAPGTDALASLRGSGARRGPRASGGAQGLVRAAAVCILAAAIVACGDPQERAAGYMARAQQLYDQGDYVKAKLEAQNALQITPKDAQAHYLLALIAEQQQEFRPMVQRLLMAVDSDPGMVPARVKLGTLYFFGQAYEQAQEQADAAAALAPDDPNVRVLKARLLLQNKEQQAAIAELDSALATDPKLIDAILLRAAAAALTDPAEGLRILDEAVERVDKDKAKPLRQVRIAILAQQGRSEDVEQEFRALIGDYPQDEEFQYQLARFYASQGRVDDAEQVMRRVVTNAPEDDVSARLGLAQFLAQMRSPAAAEEALEAFVAENPNQPELRIALGRLYEATGNTAGALSVYEELGKRDPKSKQGLAARTRVAALRIAAGETDAGREIISGVLADAPDHAEALLIRAGLRVRDQQFEDAVADVRTVLRKEPENARAMLLLARTHALMDDRVLAKDAYRRLLAMDAGNVEAPRELAALEAEDKNFEAAEDVLRQRIKVAPADVDAATRLVNLLQSQQAWGEAEQEARRIAALPESKGIGEFLLARLYHAQNKNVDAAAAYRQALDKNPGLTLAVDGLAATLMDMGRRDEATALVSDYAQKNPDNLTAKYLQGGLLARQGDKGAAARIFNEIVAARPDASMAWAALANLNSDDADARIEAYKRGLAANPGNAELGLLLGTEYERARRYDEAIAHYQELLAVNPGIDIAANNLASLLLDHRSDAKSHQQALELAKRLENASNPAMLDTVCWAYYRNGQPERALRFCERAVAAAGEVPLLRYHLGMAYLANNNPAGAKQELERAVRSADADFPGLAEAKATLGKL